VVNGELINSLQESPLLRGPGKEEIIYLKYLLKNISLRQTSVDLACLRKCILGRAPAHKVLLPFWPSPSSDSACGECRDVDDNRAAAGCWTEKIFLKKLIAECTKSLCYLF
jgi:hypothetical protein